MDLKLTQSFFDLDKRQVGLLKRYLSELKKANKEMNLVRFKDDSDLEIKHVIDSLFLSKFIDQDRINNLIDVGSGAGFPGVVLAIFYPDKNVTVVESTGKKARFIEGFAKDNKLRNLRVVNERAEILGHLPDFRERFDMVVARALGPLPVLMELLSPFCQVSGDIVAYKSLNYKEELIEATHAMDQLYVFYNKVDEYILPEEMGDRALLFFKKMGRTPEKFPRKPGVPKKKPLK